MLWRKVLACLAVVSAGLTAPLAPAQRPVSISLSGIDRGIDQGDEADRTAEAERLRLAELTVTATIAGPLADVEMDLLIAATGQDQDDDPIEARLALDLPADAVVTGYALDVEGQLIPGQLLEQAKARNVYEDEVRKGIDPGLAEVSVRNRFSTQVYPISHNKPRRVRVRFSAPFDPAKGLLLPLDTHLPVGMARFAVRAQGHPTQPQVRFAGQVLPLRRAGADWVGQTQLGETRLEGGFSLLGARQPGQMLITRHANGRRFFTITGQAEPGKPAKTGGRMRVYWDRSLSHGGAEARADEIAALVAYAEQTRPEAIDLITFASNAPNISTLADAAALNTALDQVTYRGATSLAGLDTLKLPEAKTCLLVSDGQVTIDQAAAFRPDCRLSALSADPGADGARLGRLTQRQGGQFVRIARGKGREAAADLGQSSASVVAVTSDSGGRIGWRAFSYGDGSWLVVGELPFDTRMPSPGDIQVRLVNAAGRTSEQAFAPDSGPLPINAAGALWAGAKVAELADDPTSHDAMVKLAQAFQVAGPGMSFLVLERPEQYLAADLSPPPGFSKDWLEEYAEAKADRDEEQRDAKAERLAEVVTQWQARRSWWKTDFAARGQAVRGQDKGRGGQERDQGNVAPPPPPPPPPPPAPGEPPAAERAAAASAPPPSPTRSSVRQQEAGPGEDTDEANIIVTAQRVSRPNLNSASPVTAVSGQDASAKVEVKLEAMLADRPYLQALDAASEGDRLAVLARQEAEYGTIPAFYFDVAEWFRLKGDTALSRELLLSALELAKANDETLQIVAFRLERDGEYELAVQLAERFAAGAKFRPQPRRVLALALAARGAAQGAAGRPDLERAFGLLVEAALEPNNDIDDFEGLEVIALTEANALIPRIEALGGSWKLDRRLVGLIDTDARIIIEWTADDADIDLWVDEPGGERVMYSHRLSKAGGQISNDMTDGYGPEEYAIRRAPKGAYTVRVNGYDADRINPNGPGHVLVRLFRNFGRRDAQATLVDVDLGFQKGGNRDAQGGSNKVAVMTVN